MASRWFEFDYPLKRPYPYVWFKWVVIIGGVCATALFTALSLASSGYVIHVQQTDDYNATQNQKSWTSHWPFYLLAQSTSCLGNQMSVNSKFWTDKYGLSYTLNKIWSDENQVPILTYTNNRLENCSIGYIQITLDPLEISGTQLIAPVGQTYNGGGEGNYRWSPRATAYVNCTINNGQPPTMVTLTTEYSYIVRADAMESFPRTPQKNQTSMYWGKSLLTWYWSGLSCMGWNSSYIMRAYGLVPRTTDPSINITSTDFFYVPTFWLHDNFQNQALTWDRYSLYSGGAWTVEDSMEVRIAVDWFAKAVYAVLLADLGQTDGHPRDNALLYPNQLSWLSSRIPELSADASLNKCITYDGPAQSAYQADAYNPLQITPSYIATSYQCNIPRLKSTSTLILSIFIADLVLLQSAWTLLNWATRLRLEAQDPQANHCEGCIHATNSPYLPQGVPSPRMASTTTTATGYMPVEDETQLSLRSKRQNAPFESSEDIVLERLQPRSMI